MTNPNEDKTIDATRWNGQLMNNVVRNPFLVDKAYDAQICIEHHMSPNIGANELTDLWGDEGVCSLGYNTKEYREAVYRFMVSGAPHQLPDVYPHRLRWEAASILCKRTGMDRVFFSNSGSEANEAAMKLARKYWWDKGQEDRYIVLTIEGNFHGRTGTSMAVSDSRVSPYHRIGFGPVAKGFGVLTDDFKMVVMDGVENLDGYLIEWDKVAAIIMAPILGNNLVKRYPEKFWKGLRKIRDEHETLIIFDDVQAGCGRAGYHATWADPEINFKPDIMTLGKGIAMGFPMSVMLAVNPLADTFSPGMHFNTFGGSPFVCHMAIEMFKWLDDNLAGVREKGDMIHSVFEDKMWVKSNEGAGMLQAFTPDYDKFGYDGFKFVHAARSFGLSLVTHRKFGPIRFTPPLNMPEKEIHNILELLDKVHSKVVAEQES